MVDVKPWIKARIEQNTLKIISTAEEMQNTYFDIIIMYAKISICEPSLFMLK